MKYFWRRKWQPTPVSLPGKSHGQRSLMGYSPWSCRESNTHTHTHTHICIHTTGFLGASAVKNPPAMQKMWVQSLDQDDPLEKEMPTHSSIFAWKIPWTVKPAGLWSMGLQNI